MDSVLNQFISEPNMVIVLGTLVFALLSLYFLLMTKRSSTTKRITKSKIQLPFEPAGAWPIIGHLHLLGGQNPPHITLANMAEKYGPIFSIRMGLKRALVVSSSDVAKECFTTHDLNFVSRPRHAAMKLMGYNFATFGFAPYGPYWRELRMIINRELLSQTRILSLQHVWGSEINTSIKELYDLLTSKNSITDKAEVGGGGPVTVEMKRWFADLTLNIAVKMVCGKRYFGVNSPSTSTARDVHEDDEARRCKKGMRKFDKLLGQFVVSDMIPFLGWLDLGGYQREMKNTARELDGLMQGWLEEHKRKRLEAAVSAGEGEKAAAAGEQDFMDVMLNILEDGKLSQYFDTDTINKSTCVSLLLGGSDTTMVNLVWAFTLLVKNQDALKKTRDELDIHVGRKRQVEESDLKNLVYLQAVVKETFRLYAGPISGVREAAENCTIAGYHVPAGTLLLINSWKIHRDPRVWSDPLEFHPERFLTARHAGMDVKRQNFELAPFGMGRRVCPGSAFGLQVLHLTLARLIQGFEFKTPSDAPVDMTENVGISIIKATPLEVLVTPRLPSELYV